MSTQCKCSDRVDVDGTVESASVNVPTVEFGTSDGKGIPLDVVVA